MMSRAFVWFWMKSVNRLKNDRTSMGTQTLRDLAKDFAKGSLDRDAYRRDRAALIEGIVAGTVSVEPLDFSAPVINKPAMDSTGPSKRNRQNNAVDMDEPDVFDITQVVSASGDVTPPRPQTTISRGAPPQANSNLPLVIVGIVAIVAVLGLVVVLINNKSNAPAATPVAVAPAVTMDSPVAGSEPVAVISAPVATNSATNALSEFLLAKNWSDEGLDLFQARWLALPQADRDTTADSGEILQVANAAYRKLQEIRALSGVSDAATIQKKEEKLLSFVNSLGIVDSRLTPQAPDATSTAK